MRLGNRPIPFGKSQIQPKKMAKNICVVTIPKPRRGVGHHAGTDEQYSEKLQICVAETMGMLTESISNAFHIQWVWGSPDMSAPTIDIVAPRAKSILVATVPYPKREMVNDNVHGMRGETDSEYWKRCQKIAGDNEKELTRQTRGEYHVLTVFSGEIQTPSLQVLEAAPVGRDYKFAGAKKEQPDVNITLDGEKVGSANLESEKESPELFGITEPLVKSVLVMRLPQFRQRNGESDEHYTKRCSEHAVRMQRAVRDETENKYYVLCVYDSEIKSVQIQLLTTDDGDTIDVEKLAQLIKINDGQTSV